MEDWKLAPIFIGTLRLEFGNSILSISRHNPRTLLLDPPMKHYIPTGAGCQMDGVTWVAYWLTQSPCFFAVMVTKLRQNLAAVQSAPQFLPTQVRDQALHILSYGLKDDSFTSDASWFVTRDLLSKMAPRMELMGHRYDWVPFLEKGIAIAQRFDEISRVAEYQLQLGILRLLTNLMRQSKLCGSA